ncbi:MAG: hypothetical protein Q4G43_11350, partial [Mobilicoccus sp.]|nr:hypothetical protein [Mobilicoccus sp.]
MELDLDGDDFTVEPWLYPGTPGGTCGLLAGDRFVPLTAQPGERLGRYTVAGDLTGDDETESTPATLEALLHELDVAATEERTLVVAIGSNASPAVLRRKFERRGVGAVVPMVRATAGNVAVGHSAHISRPGYVPAAPIASDGASTDVVASLLDDEQLAALDATEPNYDRLLVDATHHPLVFESGERPERYWLYVSARGVVGDDDGPTPLRSQAEIAE